jgi:hypothetical protein
VVNGSSVLRINICGENPAHRKSAKRYNSTLIEKPWFSIVSSCNTRSKSSIKKFDVSPLEVTKGTRFIFDETGFHLKPEPL